MGYSEDIAKQYGVSVTEVNKRRMSLMIARWKGDFELFARQCIKIRGKDGQLIPLLFNTAQKALHCAVEGQARETGMIRFIGCKGRRQGFSTYSDARGYWQAKLWSGQIVNVMAHIEQSSTVLFNMAKLAWEKDPLRPATVADNAKTLSFAHNGSMLQVKTAQSKGGGRGAAISYLHNSEAAYYANPVENIAASTQAVDEVKGIWGVVWKEPDRPLPFEQGIGELFGWVLPPSTIIIESTSAGNNGVFYEMFMDGYRKVGRYRSIFISWTLQPEYSVEPETWEISDDIEFGDGEAITEREYMALHKLSLGQMRWRHEKIRELRGLVKFKLEYPINIEEAFSAGNVEDMIIKPADVLRARKRKPVVIEAPLIVGIDPASGGGDRFAIVARRGQSIEYWNARNDLDPKESCDFVDTVLRKLKPADVLIDNGNLGTAIISFLHQYNSKYGDLIRGVNFGSKSQLKEYSPQKSGAVDRRAEMYQRLNEWLLAGGCIPDDDEFAADLAANRIKYRANGDWLLMSKQDLKKMGIRSPDIGDALALTFAYRKLYEKAETVPDKPLLTSHSTGYINPVEVYKSSWDWLS